MENNLRIALIGYGKMGRQHAAAVMKSDLAELVAVVDHEAVQRQAFSREYQGVAEYSEVSMMLSEVEPDVVHIVTPPATHRDVAIEVLKAGAHVYVEKPFALTAEDAQSMLDLAESRNLLVCAGHQLLFHRSSLRAREKKRLINDPVFVESYFSFRPVRHGTGQISNKEALEQLIDILPHPVYLLIDTLVADNPNDPVTFDSVTVTPRGDVSATVTSQDRIGHLAVTLRGRPIESYVKLVGTNGAIVADYILSGVTDLPGAGTSAVAQILRPFRIGWLHAKGTIASVLRIVFKRETGYGGLSSLTDAFYSSISKEEASPTSPEQILSTVRLCEEIGRKAGQRVEEDEQAAVSKLEAIEKSISPPDLDKKVILITGGTGFLGMSVTELARERGFRTRVITRKVPPARNRVPGVEYVLGDLANDIEAEIFEDVGVVLHLAAETAGGFDEHKRNSESATINLIRACIANGIRKLVNVSSVAVMVTGRQYGKPLDESAPIDLDNESRGPYVWGKARAEKAATDAAKAGKVEVRTVRLGPLVDYGSFVPPGRLGREVANLFVTMGNPWEKLFVCSTETASRALLYLAENFDDAPSLVNLLEPNPPKRHELWKKYKSRRPELTAIWVPNFALIPISSLLKLIMKLRRPHSKPLDIRAAFEAEQYDTSLARDLTAAAQRMADHSSAKP